LWEHGYDGHGLLLYEEAVQVPLVLRARGELPVGGRVRGITSAVDLPRTLLVLARARPPAGAVPLPGGPPLLTRLSDTEREDGEAFHHRRDLGDVGSRGGIDGAGATLEGLRTPPGELVGLVKDGWKAIGDPHGDLELYDLTADPAETFDLA